jgi:hypothetical protein
MEATLVLYCCTAGHLHTALRLEGGGTADDQVVGDAEDWPALKAICRDELGRFAPCGGGGGSGGTGRGERERREEGERKLEKARQLIRDIRGGPQPAPDSKVIELHNHLGTMTVAQMHQIKREHDLKASGKDKAALQAKLAVRFARTPPGGSPRPDAQVPKGTFGVPKDLTWATPEEKVTRAAHDLIGPKATAGDLLACAGVPDGSTVHVLNLSQGAEHKVEVRFAGAAKVTDPATGIVTEQLYNGKRIITREADGTKSIYNNNFDGKGSGLGMFGRQVENAARHGFESIETYAAGKGGGVTGQRNPNSDFNGYYTWPRFGYQAKLDREDIAGLPAPLQAAVERHEGKISGLMESKAGQDYWLGHGFGLHAAFDLRPGSYSQRTLLSNLKERGMVK